MTKELKVEAWSYDLAMYRVGGVYTGWEKRISSFKPCVTDGGIRNLTPLYALRTTDAARDAVLEEAAKVAESNLQLTYNGYDRTGSYYHIALSWRIAAAIRNLKAGCEQS